MQTLNMAFDKLHQFKTKGTIDAFEILFQRSSQLGIEVQGGKVDHLSRATDQGMAFRVLKDQRMGFSYTFDLSENAVNVALRTAIDIAALMPQDPLLSLVTFRDQKYTTIDSKSGHDVYDLQGIERNIEEKIELAREVERAARSVDQRITRVRKAGYDESIGEIVIVDTDGTRLSHHGTTFSTEILCVAEDGQSAETGYESISSPLSKNLKATWVGEMGGRNALELLHATPAPTRKCPAIFRNSVVAELIGFLSGSFSAENIDKNFSLLSLNKIGQQVFSKELNIYDDGLLPGGLATGAFDGEGMPQSRTTLLKAGVVESILADQYYARKMKIKATGNCSRGIKTPPSIGTTNLYLEKGPHSFEALLKQAHNGVVITEVMGLHTANPVTGEFSVGASGLLIENGQITKPVKGFAIAGNLTDLLSKVTAVGNDHRFWGTTGASSFMVSELNIGGS
ncbi:MAG TPA: TldD/PmbA family protein [Oligoflexia bacterium]|nr:TldD/PmbA family protein [Oligoflexia bacterium]